MDNNITGAIFIALLNKLSGSHNVWKYRLKSGRVRAGIGNGTECFEIMVMPEWFDKIHVPEVFEEPSWVHMEEEEIINYILSL